MKSIKKARGAWKDQGKPRLAKDHPQPVGGTQATSLENGRSKHGFGRDLLSARGPDPRFGVPARPGGSRRDFNESDPLGVEDPWAAATRPERADTTKLNEHDASGYGYEYQQEGAAASGLLGCAPASPTRAACEAKRDSRVDELHREASAVRPESRAKMRLGDARTAATQTAPTRTAAMEASIGAFGREVDKRMAAVEREVASVSNLADAAAIAAAAARQQGHVAMTAAEHVGKRADTIEGDMAELKAQIARMQMQLTSTAEVATRAAMAATSSSSTSAEDRLTARLANLGWDESAETLVSRAKGGAPRGAGLGRGAWTSGADHK